jgi:hypothetical protein
VADPVGIPEGVDEIDVGLRKGPAHGDTWSALNAWLGPSKVIAGGTKRTAAMPNTAIARIASRDSTRR